MKGSSMWFTTGMALFIILCTGAIAAVQAGTMQEQMDTGRASQNLSIAPNTPSNPGASKTITANPTDYYVNRQSSSAGLDPTGVDETEEEEDSAMPVEQGKRPPGDRANGKLAEIGVGQEPRK